MSFVSVLFLVFFPIVTALYFVAPHRYRWFILLAASVYFYMAFVPSYILILAGTIVIDYFAGRLIESAQGSRRRLYLFASIAANLGVLFFFKYFNFFAGGLVHLNILLPIGLSFHTFQSLSYTIEVYRGHQPAERRFGILALYVLFYPQMVAGPIERPQNLLHQFYERHYFELARVGAGLRQMLWGFFKKTVIADRLAFFVDPVFNNVGDYSGPALLVAVLAFAFQIYCDFSGYSDIAIGAAKVMGFDLMKNFAAPYRAQSIAEFWQRWHISLSTWFRDYVYIPLGGNRVARATWYRNLLVVFLLSGLWHGANWTFIVWGGLHGAYLIFGAATAPFRAKIIHALTLNHWPTLLKIWRTAFTFSLVTLTWIFFRAHTLADGLAIIRGLFSGWSGTWNQIFFNGSLTELLLAAAGIVFLLLVEREPTKSTLLTRIPWLRTASYAGLAALIFFLGEFTNSQFIYFQF